MTNPFWRLILFPMSQKLDLLEFYRLFADELRCKAFLEKARWADKISCPYCLSTKVYTFSNKTLYKCGKCRKQFSVRVGTIFEGSKIPLQKWFLAIYLATNLKNGVSSTQLSEYIEVSQKTAWFMIYKLKYAISTNGLSSQFKNT